MRRISDADEIRGERKREGKKKKELKRKEKKRKEKKRKEKKKERLRANGGLAFLRQICHH